MTPMNFLTLDEGLRSGDVVVTEYGNVQGINRRRHAMSGSNVTRAAKAGRR